MNVLRLIAIPFGLVALLGMFLWFCIEWQWVKRRNEFRNFEYFIGWKFTGFSKYASK